MSDCNLCRKFTPISQNQCEDDYPIFLYPTSGCRGFKPKNCGNCSHYSDNQDDANRHVCTRLHKVIRNSKKENCFKHEYPITWNK